MGTINPNSAIYGARPNDAKDDTAEIQKAIDAASDGDVLLIRRGTYIVGESTIKIDGSKPIDIEAEPGAVLVFVPAAGVTTCIQWETPLNRINDVVRKSMRGLTIRGPQADANIPVRGPYPMGDLVGIKLVNVHHGILDGVTINGFNRAGLEISGGTLDGGGAFYWDIRKLNVRHNGYGVLCSGLANATNFYALQAQYNVYGYENIQSIIGGSVEGNLRSGARYTFAGVHYSIHDVWFEANGRNQLNDTNRVREAHIWANSQEQWSGGKPISLAISGNTLFGTPFGNATHPMTNVLAGYFDMSVSGVVWVTKRDQPRYHLHPQSRIVDTSIGNHLMEPGIGGGPAADGPFRYARPTWIEGFDASKNWWSTQ